MCRIAVQALFYYMIGGFVKGFFDFYEKLFEMRKNKDRSEK